jgi:hypothetical protein
MPSLMPDRLNRRSKDGTNELFSDGLAADAEADQKRAIAVKYDARIILSPR